METWCLLVVEYSEDGGCVGWHIGVGNVNQLVRTKSMAIGQVSDEGELLHALMKRQINPVRNGGQRTTVITPLEATLPRLRTRLLVEGVDSTFRGLSHFSLEALLEQYFYSKDSAGVPRNGSGPWNIPESQFTEHDQPVRTLWRWVKQIGPLVPRRAVTGDRL